VVEEEEQQGQQQQQLGEKSFLFKFFHFFFCFLLSFFLCGAHRNLLASVWYVCFMLQCTAFSDGIRNFSETATEYISARDGNASTLCCLKRFY
jgi:hypothetical protein